MSDIIQIVDDTIEQIEEKNPDMPDDLAQRIAICLENTSALFNKSLELTEALQELTNNPHSTESCPVDDFEELLKDLTAKATEWQAINDIIAGLHPPVRRVKRVAAMEILSQLQNFHAHIIIIYDRVTVIVIHIIQIFTAIEQEENAKTTEIVTTERDTTTELTSEITTITHKVDVPTVPDTTIPVTTVETTEGGGVTKPKITCVGPAQKLKSAPKCFRAARIFATVGSLASAESAPKDRITMASGKDKTSLLSEDQRKLLISLIADHSHNKNSKMYNPGSISRKQQAWENITTSFNAIYPDSAGRSATQLKRAWEYIRA
ncbi:uncharacterized protein LOC122245539, partial [Penaeus japonicus]|uniref:uncharacterized protein LOC122245539 n=1 Tax=Penaeus japonicus TaxID=27405 RepID=UPI001C713266